MITVNIKANIFLYYFLFFTIIFILGFYLFYLQATLQISSDLTLHLNFINSILSGELTLPHEGFEYTVYGLAKLFGSTYVTASAIFLAVILVIITSTKFFLLKRLTNIPVSQAFIFSIALMLVSAIYLPMFNHNLYLGQGSPSVWHNPTLLCIKPFAFLCVYLMIVALATFNHKIWAILSILLVISFFYKPSLGIVFIPALFIYILCKHNKDYRAYFYYFLMILPSLLFAFTFQLRSWLFLPQTNNAIIIAPFAVLHLYTPNAFISFILATAFPLLFMLIMPRRILANRYLMPSWIMLGVGYLQFALLAETKCFYCANFSWGFLIALDLVFVFSFIEFIAYIKDAKLKLPTTQTLIPVFLIVLFCMHLISGIAYLGKYILTGNYF